MSAAVAFVAVLASFAAQPPDPEAEIRTSLEALEAAWRRADFEEVALRGDVAMRLIEASACPVREDGALAATMTAFSSYFQGIDASPGYLLWVAAAINEDLHVLPDETAEIVEALKSEPGEFVSQDAEFMASVYRQDEISNSNCPTPVLDVSILTYQAQGAFDQAILIERYPPRAARSHVAWRTGRLAYGYPVTLAASLHEEINAQRGQAGLAREFMVRVFDPCSHLSQRDYSWIELCTHHVTP